MNTAISCFKYKRQPLSLSIEPDRDTHRHKEREHKNMVIKRLSCNVATWNIDFTYIYYYLVCTFNTRYVFHLPYRHCLLFLSFILLTLCLLLWYYSRRHTKRRTKRTVFITAHRVKWEKVRGISIEWIELRATLINDLPWRLDTNGSQIYIYIHITQAINLSLFNACYSTDWPLNFLFWIVLI